MAITQDRLIALLETAEALRAKYEALRGRILATRSAPQAAETLLEDLQLEALTEQIGAKALETLVREREWNRATLRRNQSERHRRARKRGRYAPTETPLERAIRLSQEEDELEND